MNSNSAIAMVIVAFIAGATVVKTADVQARAKIAAIEATSAVNIECYKAQQVAIAASSTKIPECESAKSTRD